MGMTREACILEMNRLGSRNIPFCFLIDFEETKPRIWRLDEPQSEFIFMFNGRTTYGNAADSCITERTFHLEKKPISQLEYARMFNITVDHIHRGDSYLVNLTAPTSLETDLDIQQAYLLGKSKYKCLLTDEFVCFSPETFVRIEDGYIRSYPMKGTIDASISNAKERILNDEKEAAEHATIVDLIRNDLGRIATDIRVERFRYYEVIQHPFGQLGQVSSEISGKLPPNYMHQIGHLIFELLPAGSVSGAPKQRTIEIIREAEGRTRGYYTGIAGYFENGNLDSCVLIRFMQSDGTYFSGGGITHASNMEAEYQEMINKVYVPVH
jgi:para-aminobenzoate synthetase component 1